MSMIEIKTGVGDLVQELFPSNLFPFNLFDVYKVLTHSEWNWRGPLYADAFEKALDKISRRIEREGADAVRFSTRKDVFAYAKRVRKSVLLDARRAHEVQRRYSDSLQAGFDAYSTASCSWIECERRETDEWLTSAVGRDDAALYGAVHIDGLTVAEISRNGGVSEGTLRWRLKRAESKVLEAKMLEAYGSAYPVEPAQSGAAHAA